MNNLLSLPAILAALLAPSILWAQTPALPDPPLVNFPNGDAAWTMEMTSRARTIADLGATTEPSPSAKQSKIEVIRTGNLARYRITSPNKQITEYWLTENYGFFEDAASHTIHIDRNRSAGVRFDRQDGSRFGWIKPYHLVGPENYLGKPCLHYNSEMVPDKQAGPAAASPQAPGNLQAWIDKTTLLPVAYDDGQALYVYTFQAPPAAPLTLPDRCKQKLSNFEKALAMPSRIGN